MRRQRYGRGEVILAEGDPADRFFVVTSGQAEVVQRVEGRDVYVCTYEPGSFFGEVGLLTGQSRNATVRAVSEVEVATLDAQAFRAVVELSEPSADDLADVVRVRTVRVERRDDAIPLPAWTHPLQRLAKHPRAMHYNRLIALVLLANLALLAYAVWGGRWWSGTTDLDAIALAARTNLALAVILRQAWLVNLLGRLATLPSTSWPLHVRWAFAKWYHLGGLHVGTAIAGVFWYATYVGWLTYELRQGHVHASVVPVVLAYVSVALLYVILLTAAPGFRASSHDRFEVIHRFGGWTVLVLSVVSRALFVQGERGSESLVSALAREPTVWLLVVAVAGAVWPWLLLRRIPTQVERPAAHAAVVNLPGATPPIGTTRAISREPVIGWHQFALLPPPSGGTGSRMVVSRAGDWTSRSSTTRRTMSGSGDPDGRRGQRPQAVYEGGLRGHGERIAPLLGHLLTRTPPSRLVWVTKDTRATYGDALVDEILSCQPDAIIWNTDESGRPDVLRLVYAAFQESGAEAVICVSNKRITWEVVYGLERRGIPAFGPVWDS